MHEAFACLKRRHFDIHAVFIPTDENECLLNDTLSGSIDTYATNVDGTMAGMTEAEHSITALIARLHQPLSLFVHDNGTQVPSSHNCVWRCGCQAVNSHGLCLEDGWVLQPCDLHGLPSR
jgi:hypothetical protein